MRYQIQFIWFCVHCFIAVNVKASCSSKTEKKTHSEIRSKHPACHKKLEEPSFWRSCHQRLIGSLLLWVLVIGFQKTQVLSHWLRQCSRRFKDCGFTIILNMTYLRVAQQKGLSSHPARSLHIGHIQQFNKQNIVILILSNLHFLHNIISYFVYFCSTLKTTEWIIYIRFISESAFLNESNEWLVKTTMAESQMTP